MRCGAGSDATGIAVAAIRNTNHLGMLAYYVEARGGARPHRDRRLHRARRWCIPSAAPGRCSAPIRSPSACRPATAPFVLDLATSLVSMGKIHHHALRGAPLPEGWARRCRGQPDDRRRGGQVRRDRAVRRRQGLWPRPRDRASGGRARRRGPRARHPRHARRRPARNKGDVFILIDPGARRRGGHGSPPISTACAARAPPGPAARSPSPATGCAPVARPPAAAASTCPNRWAASSPRCAPPDPTTSPTEERQMSLFATLRASARDAVRHRPAPRHRPHRQPARPAGADLHRRAARRGRRPRGDGRRRSRRRARGAHR